MDDKTRPAASPLEELTAHFSSRGLRPVKCDLVKTPLFAKPATVEDYLAVAEIQNEQNVVKRARRMAGYVSKHVVDSNGDPAFTGADVARTLATQVSGEVLLDLFSQLFSDEVSAEVEAVKKKGESAS